MKFLKNIFIVFSLTIVSCQTVSKEASSNNDVISEGKVEKRSVFTSAITKKVEKIIASRNFTSFNELQMQKLDRIEENSEVVLKESETLKLSGNQVYYHLKERTMFIGSSFLCKQCPSIHLNNATGFVVHEDGVIVTNYHVIEVKDDIDVSGIFVSDHEGNVYPVTKILSASQSNDIAILKIDTKGKKLKHLALAKEELMGEDVYMMGHPFSNNFFMSKGITARKYVSERSNEPRIAITAEFGQGASGGPVVNQSGEIIGVVSATYMHYTNGSKKYGDLQLVVKEAIPVSVLHEYFK